MPAFQGLVTEEQLMQLVAYVKSLSQKSTTPAQGAPRPTTDASTTQPEVKR